MQISIEDRDDDAALAADDRTTSGTRYQAKKNSVRASEAVQISTNHTPPRVNAARN